MATADLITELNTDLNNAYTSIANKGGTVPENKNSNNLASAIDSITGGGVRPPLPEYPYPIDEEEMADGGEYGKVAYLRDDTVHYYTATSATDVNFYDSSSDSTANYVLKTLDDGFVINRNNVLGVTAGTSWTAINNFFMRAAPLLQAVYFPANGALTSIGTYCLAEDKALLSPISIPEGVTTIKSSFMANCSNWDQPLDCPSTLVSIGAYFLSGCTSFNQPLGFADGLTTIQAGFLAGCTKFNSSLVLPDTVSTISSPSSIDTTNTGFLEACTAFNQPLDMPAPLSDIPGRFLYGCTSFNSQLTFRGTITTINQLALCGCSSFNQPIPFLETATTIRGGAFNSCANFNQALNFGDSLTTIGDTAVSYTSYVVFAGLSRFDQPVTIPANVTTLGNGFLSGAKSLNSAVTFEPSSVGLYLGENFLANCVAFDQPLHVNRRLLGISSYNIARGFLAGCSSFNSPLTFLEVDNATTSGTLGTSFMDRCTNFNQPLKLPDYISVISDSVTSSGFNSAFMSNCTNFTSTLTLPARLTSIPAYFMYHTPGGEIIYPEGLTTFRQYAFYGTYATKIEIPATVTTVSSWFAYAAYDLEEVVVSSAAHPTDANSLSISSNTAASYVNGIKLSGPYAEEWKAALPDRTTTPYRKLILEEEAEVVE